MPCIICLSGGVTIGDAGLCCPGPYSGMQPGLGEKNPSISLTNVISQGQVQDHQNEHEHIICHAQVYISPEIIITVSWT